MFLRFRRLASHLVLGRAALIALALSSAGCSRFTRTRQCRTLIARVNPALDEVLALTDGGVGGSSGSASARYVSAAARYERLAKDLGPMEFSSEQMAKNVAEYASVLTASAQALRTLATALDQNNPAETDRATHELERLTLRERSAISRMDAWCQPE